jgi:putative restriction endonuclease
MNFRDGYSKSITDKNLEGSNKASSYIRALELLDEILKKRPLFGQRDFWSIESSDAIGQLYEYALEYQKKAGSEFLQPDLPPSYGRNGYYSAALKSYQEFLILRQYEDGLWTLYNEPKIDPAELGRRLARKKIKSIEVLVPERDIDFSTKEGKEVLRQTRAFNDSNTATHPGLRPPLQRRGTFKIPSTGGVPERRGGFLDLLRNGISIVKCSRTNSEEL